MTRARQMRVKSRQKLVPQICASFTKDARATNARRYAMFTRGHTSYLSRAHGPGPWRKNLSCGEISNFCTWNMWRKLKFLHKWINFKFLHMTDVEKSEISFVVCTIYGILLHFTLFCCQICFFWRFTLFCRIIGFSDLRTIMWRKI